MAYISNYNGEDIDESINIIQNIKQLFLDSIYPIGSIYLNVNEISPATFLGGTWEQIEDTFLLAAGSTYSAGETGGEATHVLTTSEMPSHTHTTSILLNQTGYSNTSFAWEAYLNTISDPISSTNGTSGTLTGLNTRRLRNTGSTGGSAAHNNMPPYFTVYMWKRID